MEARAETMRNERENALSDIWLLAKLQRAEKLPEYQKFMQQIMPASPAKPKKPMSEEMEQKWLIANLKAYGDRLDRINNQ